jgi:hypothetical protein
VAPFLPLRREKRGWGGGGGPVLAVGRHVELQWRGSWWLATAGRGGGGHQSEKRGNAWWGGGSGSGDRVPAWGR